MEPLRYLSEPRFVAGLAQYPQFPQPRLFLYLRRECGPARLPATVDGINLASDAAASRARPLDSQPPGEQWTTVMSWNTYRKPIFFEGVTPPPKEVDFPRVQSLPI